MFEMSEFPRIWCLCDTARRVVCIDDDDDDDNAMRGGVVVSNAAGIIKCDYRRGAGKTQKKLIIWHWCCLWSIVFVVVVAAIQNKIRRCPRPIFFLLRQIWCA